MTSKAWGKKTEEARKRARKKWRQSPKGKAWDKAYNQRPEVKARKKEYNIQRIIKESKNDFKSLG